MNAPSNAPVTDPPMEYSVARRLAPARLAPKAPAANSTPSPDNANTNAATTVPRCKLTRPSSGPSQANNATKATTIQLPGMATKFKNQAATQDATNVIANTDAPAVPHQGDSHQPSVHQAAAPVTVSLTPSGESSKII